MKQIPQNNPMILFDGVCNLCSEIVMFTITRDPQGDVQVHPIAIRRGAKLVEAIQSPDGLLSVVYSGRGR